MVGHRMTPFRKLEKALVADVFKESILPELSFVKDSSDELQVYPGLHYDDKKLPRIQVAVPDVDPAPGFEGRPELAEYEADLYIAFVCSAERADDDRRDDFDSLVSAVQALFSGQRSDTNLRSLLNYSGAEETDNRTVKQLYLYQARFVHQSQDPLEKGNWQLLLQYRVEFAGHDGVVLEE